MSRAEPLCVGHLLFLQKDSDFPGWYIQYYLAGQLQTTRLEINGRADAFEAATEASGFLGCPLQAIQIEGDTSPHRLYAM